MAEAAQNDTDRRRTGRTALRLTATMREGSKSRVQARVIDISTHGCRIECTSSVAADAWIWLSSAGHAASDFSPTVHGSASATSAVDRPMSSNARIVSTVATAFAGYSRYPFGRRDDTSRPCCS